MWPEAAAWADAMAGARLIGAYVRRKRFEAQVMMTAAFGGGSGGAAQQERVSAADMLARFGMRL